jgi:hypothetical protein
MQGAAGSLHCGDRNLANNMMLLVLTQGTYEAAGALVEMGNDAGVPAQQIIH